MPQYRIDDVVTIYEDPRSRLNPEGEARLRELYRVVHPESFWRIEFLDEPGEFYERTIVLEPGDEILSEATGWI